MARGRRLHGVAFHGEQGAVAGRQDQRSCLRHARWLSPPPLSQASIFCDRLAAHSVGTPALLALALALAPPATAACTLAARPLLTGIDALARRAECPFNQMKAYVRHEGSDPLYQVDARLCLLDALESVTAQQARRYYHKCGYRVEEPLSVDEALHAVGAAEEVLAQVVNCNCN